ncbi:acetyltransferase (GNAT) family protein [Ochrobactrum sp. BH3]|nr:acetyltransferase (GNAT) family protein [Ochrobactrum sp. BH3]
MSYILETSNKNDSKLEAKLLDLLVAENDRQFGKDRIDRFYVSVKDPETSEVVGGIWTETLFDWMYIEVIYIPDQLRNRGLATQLLKQAEDHAISIGCVGIWLETFEFQGPGLYLKNGYELFATQDNYPRGSKRRFLQKRFAAA